MGALTPTNGASSALDWLPIATAGPALKDGRGVLAWAGSLVVISWCDEWLDAVGRPARGVTHVADVGGPE